MSNSGIDINKGNEASRIAYGWAKKSFLHRPAGSGNPLPGVDGGFSSLMDFNGVFIGMSSDGIGTKIELAERLKKYDTIGFDLLAMVADDLAANGIETVNISNILDVDQIDLATVDQLMSGLYEAAKFARVTVTGGEIAELGQRIGGYGDGMHFNWAATGIGILPGGQPVIDGRSVKAGQQVIALQSRGFRSNGFSLVRRTLQAQFGPEWHTVRYDDRQSWGQVVITPSLIYSPLIIDLIKEKYVIHGLSHITGGGIADNFSRVLKANRLGARLTNLFEPHPFMKSLQALGNISEEQAYLLWNMGNGMLLVCNTADCEKLTQRINQSGIYTACLAGEIIDEPVVYVHSRGEKPQELIHRY